MKKMIAVAAALMLIPVMPVFAEDYGAVEGGGDVYYSDDSYGDEYYDESEYYEDGSYDDGAYYDESYDENYYDESYSDVPTDIDSLLNAYQILEQRVQALEEQIAELTGTAPAASKPSEQKSAEDKDAAEQETGETEPAEEAPQEEPQVQRDWVDGLPGIILTGESAYPEPGTDLMQYVLFFRNESEDDAAFYCQAYAKDAEGNIIGTSEESIVRVAKGYEIPVELNFSGLSYYDVIGINYSVAPLEPDEYKPAQMYLTCEAAQEGSTLNMTMTAREYTVKNAKAFIAVYQDDKMVDHSIVDFNSNLDELEPDMPIVQSYTIPSTVTYNRYRVLPMGEYSE
ncbi:MAG: hypothetical protein IJ123_01815 [Blautia sp.]|nr:hypothetical protein [Blautia sp.]